jgi:NTE family protein
MKHEIRNLVFAGAGVRGIAYGGAIAALEEAGITPGLRRVAGTSAGALAALTLAMGYSAAEVGRTMESIDWSSFVANQPGLRDLWHLVTRGWGTSDGSALLAFCERMMIGRHLSAGLTFRELAKLAEDPTSGFRELQVVVCNLNRQHSEIFSQKTTPDLPVALGVRISCSIPGCFRGIEYQGNWYCDGGLVQNYPIRIFDFPDYTDGAELEPYQTPEGTLYFNPQTLGFRTAPRAAEPIGPGMEIVGGGDYIRAVLLLAADQANKIHVGERDHRERTVWIDTAEVRAADFSISKEVDRRLIEAGRVATQAWLCSHA